MVRSSIDELSGKYKPLGAEERIAQLFRDFDKQRVFCTSSFGTTSLLLLHHLSRIAPHQIIHFIDTGNHFTETLEYKDGLAEILHLETRSLSASRDVHRYTRKNETWKTNMKYCCFLKKLSPLEKVIGDYDVWMSGLMKWQIEDPTDLRIFEEQNGILRFFPFIDYSEEDFRHFLHSTDLPMHPLVERGYTSIGCVQCTRRGYDARGRKFGIRRSECGSLA